MCAIISYPPRELPDNKFYTIHRLPGETINKSGLTPSIKFGDVVSIESPPGVRGAEEFAYIKHFNTGVRVFCKWGRLKPLTHPIIMCTQETSTDQITTTKSAVRQVAEAQPHLEYALKMLFPDAFVPEDQKVRAFQPIYKGNDPAISSSYRVHADIYVHPGYRLSGTTGHIRIEKIR